jgi:peptidoglycan/xylan/chitin deacetylase (PgdA/CDA1 family)
MLNRLAKILISLLFQTCCVVVGAVRRVFGTPRPGTYAVLTYHAVPTNARERFARQMDILLHCGEPADLQIEKNARANTHCVAVTFDDGFQSVFDNAVPELRKRRIPATVFLPPGLLGKKPEWMKETSLVFRQERIITMDEMKKQSDDLVTFGSHTFTHARLRRLSENEARKEIAASKTSIESITGKPAHFFAFPYGEWNDDLVRLAKEAGYRHAFTALPDLYPPTGREFLVGRTDVSPNDWPLEFRLKVLGAYRWMAVAVPIKRRLRHLFGLK